MEIAAETALATIPLSVAERCLRSWEAIEAAGREAAARADASWAAFQRASDDAGERARASGAAMSTAEGGRSA
jgi:hypothetical protein